MALGLGLLTVLELYPLHGFDGWDPSPPALWPVLATAAIAPLAWRRRHPLAVLGTQVVAETATLVLFHHLGFSVFVLAGLLVGAYSAVAHSENRAWSLALVLSAGIVPDVGYSLARWMGGLPGPYAVIPL